MTLNEAFARRVKEFLKEKKMTQYQLCQETGLYPSTIHYIIHAKTNASNFKSMALIIRALGVSVSEFFASPVYNFDNLEIEG
ncbi:MAG: helix-turn-helix transcriptional regulator [Clostridia bacterium]|nr:helix-turn-helix transcriptional regulator [Clostridia bacterium]